MKHTERAAIMGIVILFLAVLLVPCGAVQAAVAPAATRLMTLSNQSFPGDVAVDLGGNLYIADAYKKVVRVYTHRGGYVRTIALAKEPTALVVSPDNLLYIGEREYESGSLEVFTLNGTLVKSQALGGVPGGLAFLRSGELYVVDSTGSVVKKYDSQMNLAGQFGGFGQATGKFTEAQGIAINEAAGELYILDRGQAVTEGSYTNTYVWRVQVFDLAGAYKRSISQYGYGQLGKVGKASDIGLDDQGRLYVSDPEQGVIVVYDELGNALSAIHDNKQSMVNPVSVSSANDRLYISSLYESAVFVYGIDAYAALSVNPTSLNITWQQGMAEPAAPVALINGGAGALSWQGSANGGWLSMTPVSGDIAGNGQQDVTVSVSTAGLAAGTHTGSIGITSTGGSETVPVTLEIAAAPILSVTPNSFITPARTGDAVAPLAVTIELSNDLSNTRQWQAASDAGWLSIDKASGPSNTLVAANLGVLTTMGVGTYIGHITVTADGATGSPAVVTVNLELQSSGKIIVSTNTTAASFTIAGPNSASYSGSGASYEATGVVAGDYTITYGAVAGFKAPMTETKTLLTGGEIRFEGTYKDLRQSVSILASHGPGPKDPSDIVLYRADGTAGMIIRPFLTNYGATTAAGDVDGDGQQEIIAGAGPGSKVPAAIKGYKKDGSAIAGLDFLAFNTKFGVVVATADFDGDGRDEIIAGQGKTSSGVKIFRYINGAVQDTGVNITAYPGINLGVVVAAGDVDGDNVPELITAPEEATVIPMVNIYKIDTTATPWSATLIESIPACEAASGTNIAAGDMTGDGVAEILAVCPSTSGTTVNIVTMQGTVLSSFPTGSVVKDYIAAGDTNMDAIAEVIVGDGAVNRAKRVKVFDAQGGIIRTFDAFTSSVGVRVSIGNLGY